MRLDKFLADMALGSRKEVKKIIKKGNVKVNGKIITSDKFQVDEKCDLVFYKEEKINYQNEFYYLMNKPQGVITATTDNVDQTVMDLFQDSDYRLDLFPVGRLDKDTEGLLLITNDGPLAHHLLSPKHHVEKEYQATVSGIMSNKDVTAFFKGLTIDGDENCQPARLIIDSIDKDKEISSIRLILQEGKYHQVKRMVKAVGKEVLNLKRLRMGSLLLDENLDLGEYRELTKEEIAQLKSL
ncbi:MAG TPA: rRNA pseudouridine synthase [Candidatus Tetragenococcus pullicola]|nr:rRNA pseudouridine synthase [Candidatus Tetragenococcus pullicola]